MEFIDCGIQICCFLSFCLCPSLMPLKLIAWIKCTVLHNNGKVTHPFAVIYYRLRNVHHRQNYISHLSRSKWSIRIGFVWSFQVLHQQMQIDWYAYEMKWNEINFQKMKRKKITQPMKVLAIMSQSILISIHFYLHRCSLGQTVKRNWFSAFLCIQTNWI